MENVVLNEKESRLTICLFITIISASVLSITLGLIVLVGWHTGNNTLIQVFPLFVPMQYNTALGFVLCGSGMLLEIFKNRYPTVIIGIVVIVLGSLTLLEYLMGLNIGIDELFMKHTVTVKTSHPGRMAPNTATCFTLVGSILVFPVLFKQRIYQSLIKIGLLSLVFGLGVVALTGYLTQLETAYGWGNLTRMALHTCVGFVFLAIGFLALTWRDDITNETMVPSWLPVPIAIGALTVTICFWQAIQSEYAVIAKQSDVLTELSYYLSSAFLIVGALLSFALTLSTYLAQIFFRRSRELEKAQEELIRKERLAVLGQLTATISHDIRSPLAVPCVTPCSPLVKQLTAMRWTV